MRPPNTGRQVWHDSGGLAPIVERLGIVAEELVETVREFPQRFRRLAGTAEQFTKRAAQAGRRWLQRRTRASAVVGRANSPSAEWGGEGKPVADGSGTGDCASIGTPGQSLRQVLVDRCHCAAAGTGVHPPFPRASPPPVPAGTKEDRHPHILPQSAVRKGGGRGHWWPLTSGAGGQNGSLRGDGNERSQGASRARLGAGTWRAEWLETGRRTVAV